jgi:ABC-2 type transport system ATP-binding protein
MMSSSSDELLSRGAEPAVSIEHLRVIRFKRPALQDFSVRIARGTITGMLGPSGCGKTTLMRCIVGTQIVTSGIVDNVRYFASLYGFDNHAADAAIERVGLTDHRTAFCGNLSGGQRTRASLACALVCQPDLLVLDEPTVGLDPVLRADLWEQFAALARGGTTLLVSSHVMDEADHCGDLLLMREGCLVAHTTPTQLREDTGCTSLEDAFLSIIRRSTMRQVG